MTKTTFVKFACTVLALAGTMTVASAAAHAQKGYQPIEGAVTFVYDYSNKAPGSPSSSVNLIGGSASLAYYAGPKLAVVFDYSETYKNNLPGPSFQIAGGTVNLREETFLAGPRVAFPVKSSHIKPYVQALVGFTHDTGSAAQTATTAYGYGASVDYTHSTVSFAAGGGLDYKFSHHLSYRVAQVEYVLTTLPTTAGNVKETNIRVDTGLVVRF